VKNRAILTLIEQLVMILVFALAAAICLRAFASASQISRDSADLDRAMVIAQNAAETIKATGELPEDTEIEDYLLRATPLPTQIKGLAEAEIKVLRIEDGTPLFHLTVAWQEVGDDG